MFSLLVALALVLTPVPCCAGDALDLITAAREADRLSEASFREMLARERRLIEVSTRVRRGGVELCGGKVAPILGIQVVSLRGLPVAYVNPAIRAFGIAKEVRVASVLPREAGARAGLAPGDVILSVDGHPLESGFDLNTRRARPAATSLRFEIERAGERRALDVPYEAGCYVEPLLVLSTAWSASANSGERRIVVFSELIREVKSDDELAVVIGHELAHALLGHSRSSPRAEADADYLGLYLATLGGYDARAGAEIWNRFARTKPWTAIGSETHPSAPERALAAERALREIQEKRERGLELRPEGLE